ncbi:hypothetical protein [Paractinoplanes maris]|nr:hypothetical protein [Actinoplanes maris]
MPTTYVPGTTESAGPADPHNGGVAHVHIVYAHPAGPSFTREVLAAFRAG